MTIMYDGGVLYGVGRGTLDIECPTYTIFNRLLALVIFSLAASLRFGGALSALSEFQTESFPHLRPHFIRFQPVASHLSCARLAFVPWGLYA